VELTGVDWATYVGYLRLVSLEQLRMVACGVLTGRRRTGSGFRAFGDSFDAVAASGLVTPGWDHGDLVHDHPTWDEIHAADAPGIISVDVFLA
jgi:hypothetical protein